MLNKSVYANPSQECYYNRNNPLVEAVPPHIHRPSLVSWRPVNMWGHPFYHWIVSVATWVPPHIHRPRIFRFLRPGPHLFPCSSPTPPSPCGQCPHKRKFSFGKASINPSQSQMFKPIKDLNQIPI